ncbi:hypothetical protein [Streptomyces globisporus]|uniref:hypothetical protein n=1 Tax=Streptomyces globisporus TaxID=1908 RepID=UPI00345F5429|nr:hypothetical protein OG425_24500 [Streptomyces globisporus]
MRRRSGRAWPSRSGELWESESTVTQGSRIPIPIAAIARSGDTPECRHDQRPRHRAAVAEGLVQTAWGQPSSRAAV